MRQTANNVFLKLAIDGRIVGMVNLLYTISTALGRRVAILEDMIVDPNFRASGFGAVLLEAAIQQATKEGCGRITLLTDHDNTRAIRFYERKGFIQSPMIPLRLLLNPKEASAPHAHPRHSSCLSLRSGTSRATGERG